MSGGAFKMTEDVSVSMEQLNPEFKWPYIPGGRSVFADLFYLTLNLYFTKLRVTRLVGKTKERKVKDMLLCFMIY